MNLTDMDLVFSILEHLSQASAAIVFAYVGLKGLSGWKKQIVGKEKIKLAWDISETSYKFENKFKHFISFFGLEIIWMESDLKKGEGLPINDRKEMHQRQRPIVNELDSLIGKMQSQNLRSKVILKMDLSENILKYKTVLVKIQNEIYSYFSASFKTLEQEDFKKNFFPIEIKNQNLIKGIEENTSDMQNKLKKHT